MASALEYIYDDGVIPDDVLLALLNELLGVRDRPCTELASMLEYLRRLAESAVDIRGKYEARVDNYASAPTRAEYERAIAFVEIVYAQFDAARELSTECEHDMERLAAPPPLYTQEMHLLRETDEGRALRNFVTHTGRIDEVYYTHFRERALSSGGARQLAISRRIVGEAVLAIHVVYAHRIGVPFLQDITASTYSALVKLAEELSLRGDGASSPQSPQSQTPQTPQTPRMHETPETRETPESRTYSPERDRGRGDLASSLQSSMGAMAYSVTDVKVPKAAEAVDDGRRAIEFQALDIPRESGVRIVALPHRGTGEMAYRLSANVIAHEKIPAVKAALANILQTIPARTRLHMIASLDGIPTMAVYGVSKHDMGTNAALQKHIRTATLRLRDMFTPVQNYPPQSDRRKSYIYVVPSQTSSTTH